MSARAALLLGVLLLAGCQAARTQLVLRVDTDMAQGPGQTLSAVRVVVRSQDALAPRFERTVDLGLPPASPLRLPAELLGISARDDDASRVVTVEVTAVQGERALFTHRAVTPFVAGRTSLLEVFLAERCQEGRGDCGPGFTCGRAGCEPERRPAPPPFDRAMGADASVRDAVRDAPAGDRPADASPAGDGAACGDERCDPGENCRDCPSDCGPCPGGCGDGICNVGESCRSCPDDCNVCPVSGCGDGICQATENRCSCAGDCPQARPGDGCCTPGETRCTEAACPVRHGDGCCSRGETRCHEAAGVCVECNGNGVCECGEYFSNCPVDCTCEARCCNNRIRGFHIGSGGRTAAERAEACHALRTTACGGVGVVRMRYLGEVVYARDRPCPCCPSCASEGMETCR